MACAATKPSIAKLSEIFLSWSSLYCNIFSKDCSQPKSEQLYTYKGDKYVAKVKYSNFYSSPTQILQIFHLKLFNKNISIPIEDLPLAKKDVMHYKQDNWCIVNVVWYQEELEPMIGWAREFLQVEQVMVGLFYNEEEPKFELKIFNTSPNNASHAVFVTFEENYPCEDYETWVTPM